MTLSFAKISISQNLNNKINKCYQICQFCGFLGLYLVINEYFLRITQSTDHFGRKKNSLMHENFSWQNETCFIQKISKLNYYLDDYA